MEDSRQREKRKVPVIEVDERQLRAHVSAHEQDIMRGASKRLPDLFGSRYQSFVMCPSRQRSLSAIGAEKVLWKRLLSKCIWPGFLFAR